MRMDLFFNYTKIENKSKQQDLILSLRTLFEKNIKNI